MSPHPRLPQRRSVWVYRKNTALSPQHLNLSICAPLSIDGNLLALHVTAGTAICECSITYGCASTTMFYHIDGPHNKLSQIDMMANFIHPDFQEHVNQNARNTHHRALRRSINSKYFYEDMLRRSIQLIIILIHTIYAYVDT